MSLLRVVFLVAVATTSLAAQGRGRGNSGNPPKKDPPAVVRTTYVDRDRDADSKVIVTWFRDHPDQRWDAPGRGRGRARGHEIAPGYEKKLVRAAIIPVEYREYIVPVPITLVRLLPPVRSGWEFVMIGNRVMLVDRPAWRIVDVVVVL